MTKFEKIALELKEKYPETYNNICFEFIVDCVENAIDFMPYGYIFVQHSYNIYKNEYDNLNKYIIENYL